MYTWLSEFSGIALQLRMLTLEELFQGQPNGEMTEFAAKKQTIPESVLSKGKFIHRKRSGMLSYVMYWKFNADHEWLYWNGDVNVIHVNL